MSLDEKFRILYVEEDELNYKHIGSLLTRKVEGIVSDFLDIQLANSDDVLPLEGKKDYDLYIIGKCKWNIGLVVGSIKQQVRNPKMAVFYSNPEEKGFLEEMGIPCYPITEPPHELVNYCAGLIKEKFDEVKKNNPLE